MAKREEIRSLLEKAPVEAPQFVYWLQNVTQMYEAVGKTVVARSIAQAALARASRLPDGHPTRMTLLNMLANSWQREGDLLKRPLTWNRSPRHRIPERGPHTAAIRSRITATFTGNWESCMARWAVRTRPPRPWRKRRRVCGTTPWRWLRSTSSKGNWTRPRPSISKLPMIHAIRSKRPARGNPWLIYIGARGTRMTPRQPCSSPSPRCSSAC